MDDTDLVPDTPSPILNRKRIKSCNIHELGCDRVLKDNNSAKGRDAEEDRRVNTCTAPLSLPSQNGFSKEREYAIRRKKQRDHLSPFKAKTGGYYCETGMNPSMGKVKANLLGGFVKSSDLFSSDSGKTVKNGARNGHKIYPKRKSETLEAIPVKKCKQQKTCPKNVIRWPSSSDSSGDEELVAGWPVRRGSACSKCKTAGSPSSLAGCKTCGKHSAGNGFKNLETKHRKLLHDKSLTQFTKTKSSTVSHCPYTDTKNIDDTAYDKKSSKAASQLASPLLTPWHNYMSEKAISSTMSSSAGRSHAQASVRLSVETNSRPLDRLSAENGSRPHDRLSAETGSRPHDHLSAETGSRPQNRLSAETGSRFQACLSAETGSRPQAHLSAETGSRPQARLSAETGSRPQASLSAEIGSRPQARLSAETGSRSQARLSAETGSRPAPSPPTSTPSVHLSDSDLPDDLSNFLTPVVLSASPCSFLSMPRSADTREQWHRKNFSPKKRREGSQSNRGTLPSDVICLTPEDTAGIGSQHQPIDVESLTPGTRRAVTHIQQVHDDEDMARKLQEELDREFAMSLQNQSQNIAPPAATDMFGGGVGGFYSPQLHVPSPPRTRRRGRGSGIAQRSSRVQEELMELMGGADFFLAMSGAEGFDVGPPPRRRRGQAAAAHGFLGGMVLSPSASGNDYEFLMNLSEQIGDAKPKGLSKSQSEQLPVIVYRKQADKTDECHICMAEYDDGDNQKILPCFHSYHATCINKWIVKNATCPVCRVNVKLD